MKLVFTILSILFCVVLGTASFAQTPHKPCQNISYYGNAYTVCKFDSRTSDLRTFLYDENGQVFADFERLKTAIEVSGQELVFAMNGGMYHNDRSAAGLYIENGKQMQKLNTNKGPGNFHMLPNGVFFIGDKSAGVLESHKYATAHIKARYATQSGPMLVFDGKMHPKFNKNGTSKHIRNGVGVKGDIVYFVISNERVNFYDFASLFKDYLQTPNALYLDGAVSKIYAPALDRDDKGRPMGPMIAVVEKAK